MGSAGLGLVLGPVLLMRQAGQPGACINALCALLFLRPSKLNNLSRCYWTGVTTVSRFFRHARCSPTHLLAA